MPIVHFSWRVGPSLVQELAAALMRASLIAGLAKSFVA